MHEPTDSAYGNRLGTSGLKVSKIILGCMSYGSSKWEGSPWVLDEEESFKVIKAAYDSGINTWVREPSSARGRKKAPVRTLEKRVVPLDPC